MAFDPSARLEAVASVLEVGRDSVLVELATPVAAQLVPQRQVTLIQCLGKGAKLDAVVRDASELGASAVWPALSDRSVPTREAVRRLERVALEAARQCGRGDVLAVRPPRPLLELLAEVVADRRVCLTPGAAPLARALEGLGPSESVALVVGPEGGLSEGELARAVELGFVLAGLGRLVLRTETGAAAALGALLLFDQSL